MACTEQAKLLITKEDKYLLNTVVVNLHSWICLSAKSELTVISSSDESSLYQIVTSVISISGRISGISASFFSTIQYRRNQQERNWRLNVQVSNS